MSDTKHKQRQQERIQRQEEQQQKTRWQPETKKQVNKKKLRQVVNEHELIELRLTR